MIQYIDRKTQTVREESVYGHRSLSFLYGNFWFSTVLASVVSRSPLFSRLYGFLQKTSWSRRKIAPFLNTYSLDTSEFEKTTFSSFNDFFIRKLKKEARPLINDPKKAVMPADGRYLVFPDLSKLDHFYIKGQKFDLPLFLNNPPYATRFKDGSMVIVRLCPTDYHRFHFLGDGIPRKGGKILGDYFSVNPIALKKHPSIFWKNKRVLTDFDSDHFGKVLYVEVGATCVGTIHQTFTPDKEVKKGDEKGYFSFGGSCLVLLFEKGKMIFDDDLVKNSENGFETKANFGESLGRAL